MGDSGAGPVVLMVAEKPMLAASISRILSRGSATKRDIRPTAVHEWSGNFRGRSVRFKFTAVTGHVFSLDFYAEFNNWDAVQPLKLFEAGTEKKEASKSHMCDHLAREARGAAYLILWLDCDREGENICFEVIDSVKRVLNRSSLRPGEQQIFRAKFSAITDKEVQLFSVVYVV